MELVVDFATKGVQIKSINRKRVFPKSFCDYWHTLADLRASISQAGTLAFQFDAAHEHEKLAKRVSYRFYQRLR